MSAQKYITLVIYAALAMAGLQFSDSWIETAALVFFIALPAVHFLEYLAVRKIFAQGSGSATHHLVQTMIFGYVHWLPIKQQNFDS